MGGALVLAEVGGTRRYIHIYSWLACETAKLIASKREDLSAAVPSPRALAYTRVLLVDAFLSSSQQRRLPLPLQGLAISGVGTP